MSFGKIKTTWVKHESAVLAALLFGCGIIIGAALVKLHAGNF